MFVSDCKIYRCIFKWPIT